MQSIIEYTKMILPIIEYNVKEPSDSSFDMYLYRQSFYGYSRYFPQYISKSILKKNEDSKIVSIESFIRNNKGLKGDFILEHIWTGGMFRGEMKHLYSAGEMTVDSIVELVNNNYSMGWMTKTEKRNRANGDKIRNSSRNDEEIQYLKSLLSDQVFKYEVVLANCNNMDEYTNDNF